jgi:hypothetical protein
MRGLRSNPIIDFKAMMVIFNNATKTDLAMVCFHEDSEKQTEMMHRLDIDKQVKEWQQTHSGNPPRFYSRITIKEFTNRVLNYSNMK